MKKYIYLLLLGIPLASYVSLAEINVPVSDSLKSLSDNIGRDKIGSNNTTTDSYNSSVRDINIHNNYGSSEYPPIFHRPIYENGNQIDKKNTPIFPIKVGIKRNNGHGNGFVATAHLNGPDNGMAVFTSPRDGFRSECKAISKDGRIQVQIGDATEVSQTGLKVGESITAWTQNGDMSRSNGGWTAKCEVIEIPEKLMDFSTYKKGSNTSFSSAHFIGHIPENISIKEKISGGKKLYYKFSVKVESNIFISRKKIYSPIMLEVVDDKYNKIDLFNLSTGSTVKTLEGIMAGDYYIIINGRTGESTPLNLSINGKPLS